ncbi:hypothetical protein P154DRAFT_578707 [Amniculicola lignicola CBS 123094]|uniref:Uncharacterized protein n=1 Tax=Amniculicola lignicola CBS 123094 TaxID=1392246 RepID=A0A6A5W8Y2_9PLEO|nr:hypothetical protein P154DRAFT_578707 [Amniculicola lignicola CBS 123094]
MFMTSWRWLNERHLTGDFLFREPADYSKGDVPWALQPKKLLPCSEADFRELHLWRQSVSDIIDKHLTEFIEANGVQSKSKSLLNEGCGVDSASRRVAGIAELVEKTLRCADPITHLVVLGVCKRWRDISLLVMKPRTPAEDFQREYPCLPVKPGDDCPRDICLQPASKEDVRFMQGEVDIDHHYDRDGVFRGIQRLGIPGMPDIIKTVYYPGRLIHRPDVFQFCVFEPDSDMSSQEIPFIEGFYRNQLFWNGINAIQLHRRAKPKWVDLSQFRFNPYFRELFEDCFLDINSMVQIALK